ncbi:MAG: DegT/DnrJ/EryC1/StrS family aminotransferase [Gammaproteobacteria bacterium]
MAVIKLLEPDLPTAEELLPYLQRIDTVRWYTNFGPLVDEFEQGLLRLFFPGRDAHLTTVANGTAALELAVQALLLPPGTRVLLPTYTFPATLSAVLRSGLVPVFSDVDAQTWTLTPQIARQHLSAGNIGMVLPVATFGNPLDADSWGGFTRETGVPVVIDAAAALGSQEIVQGPVFCFSMHATKPFACGEGGLVVSTDPVVVDRVRRLSNFGIRDYQVDVLGTNAKMSEYHAAVGLAQLARWPVMRARRVALFRRYREGLAGQVGFQHSRGDFVASVLPVMVDNAATRERCEQQLAGQGIQTRRWYALPLHRTPDMRGRVSAAGDAQFPVATGLIERGLGIPFHVRLSDTDVSRVIAALARALAGEQ